MSSRGSIRKEQNGRWSFVVDLPALSDQRRQVRRRGFGTRREAQAALTELLGDAQRGEFVKLDRVTVGEYLGQWMESLPLTGRKGSTISSYRHNLRLHVLPHLGGVPLQALTPLDIDHVYGRLLQDGRRNRGGGPLSRRTVRYVHTILSTALSDAVKKGLVQRNVALAASPPSAKSAAPAETAWWTPEQLRLFLSFVDAHELGSLFRLAGLTGMRRGELVGLSWVDVDLTRSRVVVRRQVTSTDYRLHWKEPKTQRGRRVIDLDAETKTVLRRQQLTLRSEAKAPSSSDSLTPEMQLVFPSADGTVRHPETVSDTFNRLVRKSSLPRLRFHDLRHTHVAHLIGAGVDPLAISRRLGHSSVAFTLDRYGHLFDQAGAAAAQKVAALVDCGDD